MMRRATSTFALLYASKNWTITARDARTATAAYIKYMRKTAGYNQTDYIRNTEIEKRTKYRVIIKSLCT
jgi:hypothetical protein